jgi:hypothetical protein
MRTREQIIEAALARPKSDYSGDEPRVSHFAYSRDEALAVLATPANTKAEELLAGARAAGAGSELVVVREDILAALGIAVPSAAEPAEETTKEPDANRAKQKPADVS